MSQQLQPPQPPPPAAGPPADWQRQLQLAWEEGHRAAWPQPPPPAAKRPEPAQPGLDQAPPHDMEHRPGPPTTSFPRGEGFERDGWGQLVDRGVGLGLVGWRDPKEPCNREWGDNEEVYEGHWGNWIRMTFPRNFFQNPECRRVTAYEKHWSRQWEYWTGIAFRYPTRIVWKTPHLFVQIPLYLYLGEVEGAAAIWKLDHPVYNWVGGYMPPHKVPRLMPSSYGRWNDAMSLNTERSI